MKLNTCALLLLALGCLSVSAAPPMGRVVNGTDASVENYPFVVSVECREIIERKREREDWEFFLYRSRCAAQLVLTPAVARSSRSSLWWQRRIAPQVALLASSQCSLVWPISVPVDPMWWPWSGSSHMSSTIRTTTMPMISPCSKWRYLLSSTTRLSVLCSCPVWTLPRPNWMRAARVHSLAGDWMR